MVDMRDIYKNSEFTEYGEEFNLKYSTNGNCDKEWKSFKPFFIKFSKNRCPICGSEIKCKVDDIDHYRPKSEYLFLACCYKNYMIMCCYCNRIKKRDYFPLDTSFKATNINQIDKEKPLLINPCSDNIFEFFEIEFLKIGIGKGVLLIRIKVENKNSYEYKRAKETIKTYGLNDLKDKDRFPQFNLHFTLFLSVAKAVKKYNENKNKENMKNMLLALEKAKKLNYGFFEFIRKNQFKINVA